MVLTNRITAIRRFWHGLCLAAAAALLLARPAAPRAAETVESIDALYRSADALAASTPSVEVFHAASSGWARSKDFPSAKRAVESGEADQLAKVYLHEGTIVSVQIETFAGSGGWHNLRSYYYYPDGRTALVIELVSTFGFEFGPHDAPTPKELAQGDVIVDVRVSTYFDHGGAKLEERKTARVRSSSREVTGDYIHLTEAVYGSISSLPFAKWLGGAN